MKKVFLILAFFLLAAGTHAQSFHERAVALTAQLTLEEKALLMLDESPAIPRLGIKAFNWWSEALHGLANQDNVTVFPEPIGMAASFNDQLVERVFTATSDETRAKYNEQVKNNVPNTRFHSLSVWTPNVNIFRDPRWGRGQETYGEDPYLTSIMGAAVVRGLQGASPYSSPTSEEAGYLKLLACAKHYAVHSGPEYTRHTANLTDISPRDLWETYMPAFKHLVQKADVREVMCAYQRLDDDPCCGNNRLLQQILRDEWGFQYMVVSDCGAVSDFYTSHRSSSDAPHAASKAALAGTDVECGYDYAYRHLPQAVRQGLISEAEIDKHVIRLLEARFSLGEMDDPAVVPWSQIPASVLDCKEHRQLARDMARQSIVLLQNKDGLLPLKKQERIAVIGPNADDTPLLWGNYNGTPNKTVTILEGIKAYTKKVTHFKGCDLTDTRVMTSLLHECHIDGHKGVRGTFWNNRQREGKAVATTYYTHPINVTTAGQHTFADGVMMTNFSACYETTLTPKTSGEIVVRFEFCSDAKFYVNGEEMYRNHTWRNTPVRIPLQVEAGQTYTFRLEYNDVETWGANVKLNIGTEDDIDYDATVAQLKDISTVVFVGGISAQLEGEEMPVEIDGFRGGDRTNIELPQVQRRFLQALHKAGKRVVFVNCSGSAIALAPEVESCNAILQAWYAGEEGGNAVADVLFGHTNPSGKLPVTFYKSSDQLPAYEDYSMKGRTYRYFSDALFPFGYGMSYTTFAVGEATTADAQHIVIPVTNTGKRDGTEVLQVYIRRQDDADGPLRTLRAYQRVTLKAGETQQVDIPFTDETFSWFDTTSNVVHTWPGSFEVYYGNSSAEKDLKHVIVEL